MRSLVFVGWGVGLTGLFFFIFGTYELKKHGKAEQGQSFLLTSKLVESGIYRVVRHPEYVGSMLLVVGSILIAQQWFILLLGSLLLLWFIIYVLPEEDRHLIAKFGNDYTCYMKKVPRINFLAGTIRLIRRGEKS
jgi:protein-S-isoprenylcysteine O-methyltransferase Ste14